MTPQHFLVARISSRVSKRTSREAITFSWSLAFSLSRRFLVHNDLLLGIILFIYCLSVKAEKSSYKRTMNRYELHEKIGEGTFGDVYQAKKKGVPGKVRRSTEKV